MSLSNYHRSVPVMTYVIQYNYTRILWLCEPVGLNQTELLRLRDTETDRVKQVLTYSAIYVSHCLRKFQFSSVSLQL